MEHASSGSVQVIYFKNNKNNMMLFRFSTNRWWLCLLALVLSLSMKAQEKAMLTGLVSSEKGELLVDWGKRVVGKTEWPRLKQ